jgi:hypothetical protein
MENTRWFGGYMLSDKKLSEAIDWEPLFARPTDTGKDSELKILDEEEREGKLNNGQFGVGA